MNIVEEFGKIIKNGKEVELVNFLKSMTQEDRSVLRTTILDLFQRESKISLNETKKYFKNCAVSIGEIEEIHDDILTPVKLDYQKILLSIAHLVCNEEHADIPEPYSINFALEAYDKYNISSWCFPNLFCEDNYYAYNDYKKLLKCMETNQKNYTNEDIATSLSRTTFNKVSDIQEVTLNEHIWYLFQYETDIHNQYDGEGDYWIQTLKELITNTSLDKLKVVQEALLSSVRFSNRTITGYFFKMLETLNPAGKELLELQDTLFIVLQGQHSKPINQTLKYIKLIHKDKSFDLKGFIDQVPLLLSWDIKAVVNGTLSLIDTLIKAYPKQKQELALLAVQTLGQEIVSLKVRNFQILTFVKLHLAAVLHV